MNRLDGAKLTFLKSTGELSVADGAMDLQMEFLKSATEENGDVIIEGRTHTPTQDYDGDLVEADAFKDSIPQFMENPVLRWEHLHPIGFVESLETRSDGTYFKARITHDAPGQQTRDMVRRKVVKCVSARFTVNPRQQGAVALNKSQGGRLHVKKARLMEISLTDLPRNDGGRILSIQADTRTAFLKSLNAGPVTQEDKRMDPMELIAGVLSAAGYPCSKDDATTVLSSLNAAINNGQATKTLAKSFGVETGSVDDVIAAVKKAAQPDGMIAKSMYDEVTTKLENLEIELEISKHSKVTKGNIELAKSLRKLGKDVFEQWLGTVPEPPVGELPKDTRQVSFLGGAGEPMTLGREAIELAKSFGVFESEAELAKVANMRPHEVMSKLLGQPVSETEMDRREAAQAAADRASR